MALRSDKSVPSRHAGIARLAPSGGQLALWQLLERARRAAPGAGAGAPSASFRAPRRRNNTPDAPGAAGSTAKKSPRQAGPRASEIGAAAGGPTYDHCDDTRKIG